MIQHLKQPKHRFFLAISLMVIASLALSIQAMFVKLASDNLSTNFLTFARSVTSLLSLFLWIIFSSRVKIADLYRTNQIKNHAVRSIFGLGAIYCFYFSINNLSLETGTLIFYSFPLFVPLVSRVWLGVQYIHRLWWGLGVSFTGLFFVIQSNPSNSFCHPFAIIPLTGAILAAIGYVAVRILNYTEPWERVATYFFSFSFLITSIVLYFSPTEKELYTFKSLSFAFLAGCFATIFQAMITLSAKFAPMRLISPFVYLSFIFGAIIQFLIWKEAISIKVFFGFALIVIGTILLLFLYPKDDLKCIDREKGKTISK